MSNSKNYLEVNKEAWNDRAKVHFDSEFYDNKTFIEGRNSLNSIELEILGDVTGKKILHLQCHFGQDTISLQRMGAQATGVDFSDEAIRKAQELAKTVGQEARFICTDVYSLPEVLDEKFDIVFTSYGTIGWLPDIDKWAGVVSHFLKPGGKFVFAEFHPVVWMFDDDFEKVVYRYFKTNPILDEEGTYTDGAEDMNHNYISWNHGLSEVTTALGKKGISIDLLSEFDYSPYNCFNKTKEIAPNKFVIEHFGNKIPMVYSILGTKRIAD